ncbi:MAG: histone deacetylase [Bacteroidetes bacterium]|nr:histone deacetylase [Bacteroidota bacterium]
MLKIALSPIFAHPLPEGHRFPMEKYSLLPEQLLFEGTVSESNFFLPELPAEELILTTHQESYLTRLKNLELSKAEIRAIGFPLSNPLIEREICIAGGSVQAACFAKNFGIGMNVAGGTHHAFYNRGEGFCILNDLAITANYLLNFKLAQKVLIVDLDVHQGNGTASLFRDNSSVFTFSMHGEKNYPHRKERSDLDIGLADGTDDATYMGILDLHLKRIMDLEQPDFILYQSGVDVLSTDLLGRLSLTLAGVHARDRLVLTIAKTQGVPIMCCMGGGYSERLRDIVDAHAQVFRLAQDLFF